MKRLPTIYLVLSLSLIMTGCTGQKHDHTYLSCLENHPVQPTNMAETFQNLHDCVIGSTLLPFEFVTSDGTSYRSENFKGKVTLISMWFTTCAPCVVEIPFLNHLHDSLSSEKFQMFSFTPDSEDIVRQFRSKQRIDFPVVANANVLLEKKFKINSLGYPTIIILDEDSKVLEFTVGGPTDHAQATQQFVHLKKVITDNFKE